MPVWSARPPEGWEAVAEVCRSVFDALPVLTDRINAKITAEIPEFAPAVSPMKPIDLLWSTSRNIAGILHGIAENRGPGEDEISFRRLIGKRSAARGLPLDALIESFRIGFLEVWATLVDEALREDGRSPVLLLKGGSGVWQWMVVTSNALADAYTTEISRRQASEMRATAHFVEELLRDPASPACRALASEIGLRPDAPIRMLTVVGPSGADDVGRALIDAMQHLGATVKSAQRGRATIVVSQDIDGDSIDKVLADMPEAILVGVGLEWLGLEGARTSLREAELALEVAVARRRSCRFEDDWFRAIGLSYGDSIERLLARGIGIASSKTYLVDAVRMFAESGFSVAEGARRLGISPTAFRYRLTRWESLTGWSPWTHDGILRSLVAFDFASEKGASRTATE